MRYRITEVDYLKYHLYQALKSNDIQVNRKLMLRIDPWIYIALSLYFFSKSNLFLSLFFFCLWGICFFFYPILDQKKWIRFYKKYVKKTYKNQINNFQEVEFCENHIEIQNISRKAKICITHVEKIIELQTIIFIQLKDGMSIILPKNEMNHLDDVKKFLQEWAEKFKIKYELDESWE